MSAGQGKQILAVDAAICTGKIEVTAAVVSGGYTCKGVTAYDAGTGKMSRADLVVSFDARS